MRFGFLTAVAGRCRSLIANPRRLARRGKGMAALAQDPACSTTKTAAAGGPAEGAEYDCDALPRRLEL
jgi:hypothetical protein